MEASGWFRKRVKQFAVHRARHDRAGASWPEIRFVDIVSGKNGWSGIRSASVCATLCASVGFAYAMPVSHGISKNDNYNISMGEIENNIRKMKDSLVDDDYLKIIEWYSKIVNDVESELEIKQSSIKEHLDVTKGYLSKIEGYSSNISPESTGKSDNELFGSGRDEFEGEWEDAVAPDWISSAKAERPIALGADAAASGVDSVALGAGSQATRDNTVSVEQAGGERQIVHVAPGTEGTDAVNVNQLNSALKTITVQSERRFGELQRQIDATARSAYAGVAAATALTMIPDVDRNKTLSIGIGVGSYKGYHAMALGGTAWLSSNLKVRTGIGLSSEGKTIGVGMSWLQ